MKYYVAHNNEDVFHFGTVEDNQQLDTGQPYFKEYKTKKGLTNFLNKKNVEYNDTFLEL